MENNFFKQDNNTVFSDGTFDYTLLPDGTYSISISRNAPKTEEINIPESFVPKKEGEPNSNVIAEADFDFSLPITEIGARAFYGSDNIPKITICKSIKRIGQEAFARSDIREIVVDPENPYFYSEGNCVISKETHTIVAGCDTSVIPNDPKINAIDDHAFSGCRRLDNVTIPGNIKIIGVFAFAECESLKNLTICEGVETIYIGAFSSCKKLTEINLPQGLINIGGMAFFMCESLESVSIPASVSSIGGDAFACCSALKNFTFPESEKRWNQICNAGAYHSNIKDIISFGKTKKKFSLFKGKRI